MKRLLLLALCSGSYCDAFAKDSDWKICKGEVQIFDESARLVVNTFEHRNAEGRANDLTFIYGGNVLRGSFNSSESTSGAVKLKGTNATFKGMVAVDYQMNIINLVGNFTLNKTTSAINTNLECETL